MKEYEAYSLRIVQASLDRYLRRKYYSASISGQNVRDAKAKKICPRELSRTLE